MIIDVGTGRLTGQRCGSGRTRLAEAIATLVTVFGALLALTAAGLAGPAPLAAGAVAMAGYVLVGRVLVHEAGHLLAAVLVRLPVTAVRLRLIGAVSRVEVARPASGRWLSARMTAFAAAGPLADLLMAAAAFQGFRHTGESLAQASLLTVAVSAAVSGLHNLVPLQLADGLRSDGANLFRRLPRSQAELLQVPCGRPRIRHLRARPGGRAATPEHLDALRTVMDRSGDPTAVGAAALALLADYTRMASAPSKADAARLASAARSTELSPTVAARVSAGLAWTESHALLRGVVLLNTAPAPDRVAAAVKLAELGYQLDPTTAQICYVLAMARLWQGRVAEARELTRDTDHAAPEDRAAGLLVRALVEMRSASGADPTALLAEAVRAGCPAGLAWLGSRLPWALDAGR